MHISPIIEKYLFMKANYFLPLIISSIFIISSIAQVPSTFKYQALIRNSYGKILAEKNISVKISIVKNSITGPIVYSETHLVSTSNQGLINLEIGKGTVFIGVFNSIIWSNDIYYVRTEIDENGATNYTLISTSQLLSVPYALLSKNVEIESDPIFITSVAKGLKASDTLRWSNKLSDETDPIFNSSVAIGIKASDTTKWSNKISVESDPIFNTSVAKGIKTSDTLKWSNKLSAETDPIFNSSVAKGIKASDTTKWSNKLTVESDPSFSSSVAKGITPVDTTRWGSLNKIFLARPYGGNFVGGKLAFGNETTESSYLSNLTIKTNHNTYGTGNSNIVIENFSDNGYLSAKCFVFLGQTSIWSTQSNAMSVIGNLILKTSNSTSFPNFGFGTFGRLQFDNYTPIGTNTQYLAGSCSKIEGNISSYPENSVIAACLGIDDINTESTFAGYFKGKLYTSDKVGIGIKVPKRMLHVKEAMRLEPQTAAPSNPQEGDIYMDAISHKLKVYDGTIWQSCW